jgi:hypothetical protein
VSENYDAEAQQRWGDTDAWKQSRERTAKLTKEDWIAVKADTDALEASLADGLRRGVRAGSAEANALAEQHRTSIDRFYDCDHEMQVCLAHMYVADPRFTRHYDNIAPGLAQFVHDIIVANAEARG